LLFFAFSAQPLVEPPGDRVSAVAKERRNLT